MRPGFVASAACLAGLAAIGGYALLVNKDPGTKGAAASPTGTDILPAGLFLTREPDSAVSVEAAKETAKVGDTVTMRGRVGGGSEPFVEGRAVFTLVGRGIPACSDIPGHGCNTPWDYCHVPQDELAAHSATVQMVDGAGNVLKTTVKGRGGIKELSELVVVGRVSQTDGQTLVVNATGVYVAAE